MKPSILIVDDEQSARDLCEESAKEMGFDTELAESGRRAWAILESRHKDIVLSDVRMPDMDGIDLLKMTKLKYPDTDVVMMTGYGTIAASVEAMKLGASDYITKPFQISDFKHRLQKLVENQEQLVENRLLHKELNQQHGFAGLIGTSASMRSVYRLIMKAAQQHYPVLILGESGTGKELVARAIHAHSPWKEKPFVAVDCGALSSTLIDSELFGHVRGAYTGADRAREGLFASAKSGTLLLDEIAELPVELQTKFLRALQEHEIRVVGDSHWTQLEARIIAATNQDIQAAIERGSVRKDLYYRLNILSIVVPPLRERKSDIPVLVHAFIDRYGGSEGRVTGISDDAMHRIMGYNWPGNVRELENCVQRAFVIGSGHLIEPEDLPFPLFYSKASEGQCGKLLTMEEVEQRTIMEALRATGGNPVRAAKILGIGKTTIYRKLKEFGYETHRAQFKVA